MHVESFSDASRGGMFALPSYANDAFPTSPSLSTVSASHGCKSRSRLVTATHDSEGSALAHHQTALTERRGPYWATRGGGSKESKAIKERNNEGNGKRRGPKARALKAIPIPPARGTSSVATPTSPATELRRDANAGASILHKACESGWWEWSQGSTLIFLALASGGAMTSGTRWDGGLPKI
jgi:hypothetical protein